MKKKIVKKWGSTILAGSLLMNASPVALAAPTTSTTTTKTVTTGRTDQSQITGIITPNPIPTRVNNAQTVTLSGTVTIDGPKLGLTVNGVDVTNSAKITKKSNNVWSYEYVATLDNVVNNIPGDETFIIGAYTMYQNGKPGGDIHTQARPITQTVDLTPPQITINSYDKDPTNQDVVVTASTNEGTLNATSHTFTQNGSFEFIATDSAGNVSKQTVTVDNIDKTAPTATVDYSTISPINTDVVATIKPSEDVTYTNLKQLPEYTTFDQTNGTMTYTENGEFNLEFKDKAGNTGSVLVKVNNIDKTAPIGSVTYSTTDPTNQDVTVTLNANEPITVTNNGGSLSKTFSENGSFTFNFEDTAGNKGTAEVNVTNIDKTPPTATLEYSTTKATNGDVTVTIHPSESVTVLNNNGALTKNFSENGSFTFEFVDAAGNHGSAEVNVSNIDKTPPVITVDPYNTNPTNQNVTVTVSTNEGTLNATSHTFTENGSFDFVATDEAGNTTTNTVQITNIDKVAPVITVEDYNTSPTNQDVTVNVSTNEGTLNTTSHTFTENGSFGFIASDAAGNSTTKTVTISNIDKTAPEITIGDFSTDPTNQDITVTATTNEGTLNATSHTFKENGSFDFIATDAVGNTTTKTVTISNIDKDAPVITILTYNTAPTNQDVVVSASTNEGSLNTASHTFTENGTFTFVSTDAAGNRTEYPVTITNIDKVAPVITVDSYNTDPTNQDVVVTASTNEGTLNESSHTFTTNGSFTFTATDTAGNTSTKTVTLTNIDKTPPVVSGVTNGGAYNVNVSPSFNEGTATLDSSSFTTDTFVSAEGNHTLVVTDAAGNTTTVSFTIDKSAPVVSGVKNGQYYNVNVTPAFNEGTATLNGKTFISGSTVSTEGNYNLVVTDSASNTTTVSFTIDKSAPSNPVGPKAHNTGNGNNTTIVNGSAEAGATVIVVNTNGEEVGIASVGSNGTFSVNISPVLSSNTTLNVYAVDQAGNKSGNTSVSWQKN
jgi:hypothetical protein